MSERTVKRLLQQVPVDRSAEERAWAVVRAAYAERGAAARRAGPASLRWVVVFAVLVAVVAAAVLSPPGRALVDAVRRTIGVDHAAPALFRLPAPGRLLVSGPGGTWVVSMDGSKRRLGDYGHAAWSPHGLFVLASAANQLAAVEPDDGTVRWTIARRRVEFPRWGGSRTDTRVAYLSGRRVHVVGGNGVGDSAPRALPAAARIAPTWQPGDRRVLAYVTAAGRVELFDADAAAVRWVSRAFARPRLLAWSRDGRRLVVATAARLVLLEPATGRRLREIAFAGAQAVAYDPAGRLALLRGRTIYEVRHGRVQPLFTAPPGGRLNGLAWSPDGRWLLTSLPAADQWIFVGGGGRVLAVSHIARQFDGRPSLDGWVPGA
jgi:hypothetical protein